MVGGGPGDGGGIGPAAPLREVFGDFQERGSFRMQRAKEEKLLDPSNFDNIAG